MGKLKQTCLALLLTASALFGGLENKIQTTNPSSYVIPGFAQFLFKYNKRANLSISEGKEDLEAGSLEIPSFNKIINYLMRIVNTKFFSRNVFYEFERQGDSLYYQEVIYNDKAKEDTFKFRTKTIPWEQRYDILIYDIARLVTLPDLSAYLKFRERNEDLYAGEPGVKRYIADSTAVIWIEEEKISPDTLELDVRLPTISKDVPIRVKFPIDEKGNLGIPFAESRYAGCVFIAGLKE